MPLEKQCALLALFFAIFFLVSNALEPEKPSSVRTHPFILILDSAGDQRQPGRCIGDCFERGITLQWAQKLKQDIESRTKNITVIIARRAGETIESHHTAQLANRSHADLVLSLHAYYQSTAPNRCTLYHFSQNDEFIVPPHGLAFCPYDQAHLYSCQKTAAYAHSLHTALSTHESLQGMCTLYPPCTLPIKQLIGIKAPALLVEIGIENPVQWQLFIAPLAQWVAELANPAPVLPL